MLFLACIGHFCGSQCSKVPVDIDDRKVPNDWKLKGDSKSLQELYGYGLSCATSRAKCVMHQEIFVTKICLFINFEVDVVEAQLMARTRDLDSSYQFPEVSSSLGVVLTSQ